jgi:anti-sigma regulatory factor (Ser/Thr protein kinase)
VGASWNSKGKAGTLHKSAIKAVAAAKAVLHEFSVWVRKEEMDHTVRISLPARAESVPVARKTALAAARRWLSPDQAPSLALMVSEVFTNALVHGGGGDDDDVELTVTGQDEVLRVEVCDHGAGFVPAPKALEHDRAGGFGLYLVEQLADRWGWSRDECTLVWFEVAVPQAAAAFN